MGCAASTPADGANLPQPGQHRYSCDDTECPGCCSQPRSPSSARRRQQHDGGTKQSLPSNSTSLFASREAEYAEVATTCPSRALSSRGSSCGEPSPVMVQLRQAKNVFVAKVFNDISEDPDQFDAEAIPQYVLDDSRKAVVDSGWLDAIVAVMNSDDDLESLRSYASVSRQSDAVFSRTSGWCSATIGGNSTSNGGCGCGGGEGGGGVGGSCASSPLERTAFPPGYVYGDMAGESPTSTQASGAGPRRSRNTAAGAHGSALTERALLRLAQVTDRRPSCHTGSTPALTPRLGVSL